MKIYTLIFSAFVLISCNSNENSETTSVETTVPDDGLFHITTPGYKGTIDLPENVEIDNWDSHDLTNGGTSQYMMVSMKGGFEFSIKEGVETLDSLKRKMEDEDGLVVFEEHIEEGENYVLSRFSLFPEGEMYRFAAVNTTTSKNYVMQTDDRDWDLETARILLNCALSYKPE